MKLTSLLSIEAIPTKLGRLLTSQSHLTSFQKKQRSDTEIESASRAFELSSFETATHYNPDGSRTEKNEKMPTPLSAEPSTEEHDTVCRTGNPAVIGWYNAYAYNYNSYRYWNGLDWSIAVVANEAYTDEEFKARRNTLRDKCLNIFWSTEPVPAWILECEAKLYPTLNKKVKADEVVWHEGPPPKAGWYVASCSNDTGAAYFWDGNEWFAGYDQEYLVKTEDRFKSERGYRIHGAVGYDGVVVKWTNLPVPQAILDLEEKLFPKATDKKDSLLDDKTRPQGWYRFTDGSNATYFRYYDNMSGYWSSFLSEFEAGAFLVTEIEGRTRSIPGLTTAALLKNGSIVISLDNLPQRLRNWF